MLEDLKNNRQTKKKQPEARRTIDGGEQHS